MSRLKINRSARMYVFNQCFAVPDDVGRSHITVVPETTFKNRGGKVESAKFSRTQTVDHVANSARLALQ